MKKIMLLLLMACLLGLIGTAPVQAQPVAEEKPLPIEGTRAARYSRLAFVCAPGKGADPKYVTIILNEIESTASKYFSGANLQKVSFIPDASIDTGSATPTVQFKNMNDYDAVAVITYIYSPMVFMDINLIDVKTGQRIWFLQLHAKPENIEYQLYRLAKVVPHRINKYFYRKG
jgi:hypothetical protein